MIKYFCNYDRKSRPFGACYDVMGDFFPDFNRKIGFWRLGHDRVKPLSEKNLN